MTAEEFLTKNDMNLERKTYTRDDVVKFAETYHCEALKEITDEEIMTYFNNHSNCYSNDSHINIPAMTRGAVLEFAKWMRDRMIGGKF